MKIKLYVMSCCLGLALTVQSGFARSAYPSQIPNGSINSCDNCHDPATFARNAFAADFKANGYLWNAILAAKDSDGDGASNGQELNDPTGAWRAGNPAPGGTVTLPGDASSKPPPTVVAPAITAQPASKTVTAGANVTFSVTASGTVPLSYQWQKDGAALTGATSATLALSNVTAAQAGAYAVKVSNAAGSVTSATATLTVNAAAVAPAITAQPASKTVTAGANVTFSVTASGTAPLSYQWQKDGAALTGATSATLALSNVTAAQAGAYAVKVSNAAGSVTSATATLTVNAAVAAPKITLQPISKTVSVGANVSFMVGASGTAPLSYQWLKDGSPVASGTGPSLLLNNVQENQSGVYTATVSNLAGSVTSAAATLTVKPVVVENPMVTVIATDPGASEAGTNSGTFRVARTGATTAPLTVYYILGGTATNGLDYEELPGFVSIPAGVDSADIAVTPLKDVETTTETNEMVILQLNAPPAGEPVYDIGSPSNAVVVITENAVTTTNQRPIVHLLMPENGDTFKSPQRIVLVGHAVDWDGTITKVEFYAGKTLIGLGMPLPKEDAEDEDDDGKEREDSRSDQEHYKSKDLYFVVWTQAPEGTHSLTVKATDDKGAMKTSKPVTIRVTSRSRYSSHRD